MFKTGLSQSGDSARLAWPPAPAVAALSVRRNQEPDIASYQDQALSGKVVFVSGASPNLGSVISAALGAAGALVVVHYDSNGSRSEAENVVAQINSGPGEAFAVHADLTLPHQVERAFDKALCRFGKIHYAINTVGVQLKRPLTQIAEHDLVRTLEVSSEAAFHVMREAARRIVDDGEIVTISTSLGSFLMMREAARRINGHDKSITITTSLLATQTGLTPAYLSETSPECSTQARARRSFNWPPWGADMVSGPADLFLRPAQGQFACGGPSAMGSNFAGEREIALWVRRLLTEC
ncbi:SDR family NAD(P)-dependent oxidoreductase (plasmid) [Streptomyces murinus]|uniref:SDR family NAD(P)-dependent oxidoreductase n=1 Tax=Streptomyces murinus TaxID=33900 RepID=UPI000A1EE54D|nr:SDR family NAD(P)-dependent oxidoreductase [Streptomyces murinus]WDO11203.1 SDR family NAD(P)-dependent oxidoreductase [Streptomyces murinus]